jgi:hypothetical protein
MGRPPLSIKRLVGLNLVLDGFSDITNGMLGASSGTNYGENNSLMAITRNFSVPCLVSARAIAMLIAFVAKLSALVGTIPPFVTGGLAIYRFGVIGVQGIALMISERVNMFDPRQLAIAAVVLVVGIGGDTFEGGNLPFFDWEVPAIASAAGAGIILNLLFLFQLDGSAGAAGARADGHRTWSRGVALRCRVCHGSRIALLMTHSRSAARGPGPYRKATARQKAASPPWNRHGKQPNSIFWSRTSSIWPPRFSMWMMSCGNKCVCMI